MMSLKATVKVIVGIIIATIIALFIGSHTYVETHMDLNDEYEYYTAGYFNDMPMDSIANADRIEVSWR